VHLGNELTRGIIGLCVSDLSETIRQCDVDILQLPVFTKAMAAEFAADAALPVVIVGLSCEARI
jgi:hypothetical protein